MFMHFSYGRKVKHTHKKNPTLYKTIVADVWDSIKLSLQKRDAQYRLSLLQTLKNICLFCSFVFPEQNILEMFVLDFK